MKKDTRPAADREREALQWAINYFRNCAADLKPAGSKRKMNELEKKLHIDWANSGPQNLHAELTAYLAYPDDGIDLFGLAATLIERGDPLPAPLRDYVASFLRNPKKKMNRKRGRRASTLEWRNSLITDALYQIVIRWNLRATRNPNPKTERASAASIVQQAMVEGAQYHLLEGDINKLCAGIGDFSDALDKFRENLPDNWKGLPPIS